MPVAPAKPAAPPAAEPAPAPTPEPAAAVAADDDIPLPDEPVDDYDAPVPDDGRPSTPRSVEPEPQPEPEPQTGLDVETARKRFQEVRAAVRERSKSLEPMLSNAVVDEIRDNVVILAHPIEVLVGRLSSPHAVSIMREALHEVFGTELDVQTIHKVVDVTAPTKNAAGQPDRQQRRAQTFSRPSRARGSSGEQSDAAAAPEAPAEPEEPEPPRQDDDIPDAERAEMVAEVQNAAPEGRFDPIKVAMELLQTELGARPLE